MIISPPLPPLLSLFLFSFSATQVSTDHEHSTPAANATQSRLQAHAPKHSAIGSYISLYPPEFNQLINDNVHSPNPIKNPTQTQIFQMNCCLFRIR